jgi:hypothetical protein
MTTEDIKVPQGEVLKELWSKGFSFEKVTLLKDTGLTANLQPGQVLEASSTKYVVCTTGASAACVLMEEVSYEDLVAADVKAMVLMRGPAVLEQDFLTITSAQLTAAIAALKALSPPIIVRDGALTWTEQTA